MDSQNFFDFDVSLKPDEGQYLGDGDEYDILNSETFGSDTVDGNWEEHHEKLASLSHVENEIKFDALSISKQIREENSLYSSNRFQSPDGNFSPLGDSIWSSPPNTYSSKFLHSNQEQPKTETTFDKTFPIGGGTGLQVTRNPLTTELERGIQSTRPVFSSNILDDHSQRETNALPNTQSVSVHNSANTLFLNRSAYRGVPSFPNSHNRPMPGVLRPNRPFYPNNVNIPVNGGGNWNNFNQRSFPRPIIDGRFLHPMRLNRPSMNHFDERKQFELNSYFNGTNAMNENLNRSNHLDELAKSNRHMESEWDEWHRKRLLDPYSGLMTPREQAWLRNIQMMQLTSNNPYQDDYYYMVMKLKRQQKHNDAMIKISGYQVLNDKSKDGKEYEPPSMKNSLGKLQVLSVHAPRKIVDLQVVHLDPMAPTTPLQKEMRKHRHVLLFIEKLCNLQIEFDDVQRKIRCLGDCPTRDAYLEQSRQLVDRMWNGFSSSEILFVKLLCVRKGKTLLARFIHWLKHKYMFELLLMIIDNISAIQKKDVPDMCLSLLWPATDNFLSSATCEQYSILATKLTPHLNNALASLIIECPYAWTLVLRLVVGAEQFVPELITQESWQDFLRSLIMCLCCVSADLCKLTLQSVSLRASAEHLINHLERCMNIDSAHKLDAIARIRQVFFFLKDVPPVT